jgi:hypothetical protein
MPSDHDDVYLEALRRLAQQYHDDGAHGLLLIGLPDVPVRALAEALGGPSAVAVSLVGMKDAKDDVRWAREQGWDAARFGADADATHAVSVRNNDDLPEGIIRLAVAQGEVARLGSLQDSWYRRLGTDEITAQVCQIGAEQAENDRWRDLFNALASEAVASHFSIEQLVRYHNAVFAAPAEQAVDAPRQNLPLLNLLYDEDLLTGSRAPKRRLLTNADLVDQLLHPDEQDETRADWNVRRHDDLRGAYRAFKRLRRDDLGALSDLSFQQAERLFSKPQPPDGEAESETPDDDESPDDDAEDGANDVDVSDDDEPPTYDHPAEAAVDLAAEGREAQIGELIDQAVRDALRGGPSDDKIETEHATFSAAPDPLAAALTRATIGEECYGGALHAEEPLDALLDTDTPEEYGASERFALFDAVRMKKLRALMKRAREVDPDFNGGALLKEYQDQRAALTRPASFDTNESDEDDGLPLTHAHVLSQKQWAFTYLAGRPDVLESVRAATDAYQRLMSHLREHFHTIYESSPRGAERLCQEILALDLIVLHGRDGQTGALLSPLSPLVLWKHRAVAELVRERRRKLSDADRTLLHDELRDLPEPLRSLHAPPGPDDDDGESTTLISAGRHVGTLPLYRPSTVEVDDVSAGSLAQAAQKLSALYPPARRNLRVVLLNPDSLAPAAAAARTLLDENHDFEHVTLRVARLGTRSPRDGKARRSPGKEVNALGEKHAEGRVTLETLRAPDVETLAEHLQKQPAHLLAVAGKTRRASGDVRREATRLHPLSIPRRLNMDVMTGELSLDHRSNRAPEGRAPHPYGLYRDLVSTLMRRPQRDDTLREEQRVSLEDHRSLLDGASFYVVAGTLQRQDPDDANEGDGRSDDEPLLRLTQDSGRHGDAVYTRSTAARILRSIRRLMTKGNYAPTDEGLRTLLRRIESVGGEGLFKTVTPSAQGGFSEKALKGHVGLAVALGWYQAQADGADHLILSLDSPMARSWLGRRDDDTRADLLGVRRLPDGQLTVDVIEVKSYAATGADRIDASRAAEQLHAVARVLERMLQEPGELLADCRRELLRLQVYREGLKNRPEVERDWVHTLNDVLDGETRPALNRLLIEVRLQENTPTQIDEEETEHGPIRRIRLAEEAIQKHLSGVIEPASAALDAERANGAPSPSDGTAGTPDDDSSAEPTDPPEPSSQAAPPPPETASGTPEEGDVTGDSSDSNERDAAAPMSSTGQERSPHSFAPDPSEQGRIADTAKDIYKALEDHGINLAGTVDPEQADVGPNVVRYKVRLQSGEQLSHVQKVTRDLMRELALRKEPLAGNLAGTRFIHLDVPRPQRKTALLQPVLAQAENAEERPPYSVPAGVGPDGSVKWLSVLDLPHMLVAGATQSGKSVFLRSLVLSLATLYAPEALQLVLVDQKRVDFGLFNALPHLRNGAVIHEPETVINVLEELVEREIEARTQALEEHLSLNIRDYNANHPEDSIPPVVVVIDEYAELREAMTDEQQDAFEQSVQRLAQRARNVGSPRRRHATPHRRHRGRHDES